MLLNAISFRGTKRDCLGCPVALAILDLVIPSAFVSVGLYGGGVSRLWTIAEKLRFDLPEEVGDWISDFDCAMQRKTPISFELTLPKDLLKGV